MSIRDSKVRLDNKQLYIREILLRYLNFDSFGIITSKKFHQNKPGCVGHIATDIQKDSESNNGLDINKMVDVIIISVRNLQEQKCIQKFWFKTRSGSTDITLALASWRAHF